MKKLIKIYYLLVFGLLLSSTLYAQDCTGVIEVTSNLPGSYVFVDDSLAGTGSLTLELPLGEYHIKVVESQESWGAKVLEEFAELTFCNEKVALDFEFEEGIYLETTPDDAYVYEADTLIGHTPLFLPLETSRIELRKPMYESKIIEISRNRSMQAVPLNFTGEKRKERFGESTWFKVLVGTAVALGATAAYYKIKADNRYEEYENTQDPGLLQEVDDYDLYSGLAFGVLQVNLAYILFSFLNE